jgi:hypothetical protein
MKYLHSPVQFLSAVTFSAAGDLSLSGTSILVPDIRSSTSHSPLVTEGTANVGGTLKPMFTGVTPILGNHWTIIDAATAINGTFLLDLSVAPALPAGQSYEIMQVTDGTRKLLQLSVAEAALPGDYNGDDSVDAADYVLWRKDPSAFGGDPDGYNTWRAHFGQTAGSGSAHLAPSDSPEANFAVPEPASLMLLFHAAVLGLTPRRSLASFPPAFKHRFLATCAVARR